MRDRLVVIYLSDDDDRMLLIRLRGVDAVGVDTAGSKPASGVLKPKGSGELG